MLANLQQSILLDQLFAVRKTVSISIPINILLGIASLLVAAHDGKPILGLSWFTASLAINIGRVILCRLPVKLESGTKVNVENSWVLNVNQHLRAHWITALVSGCVWAMVPILCDWFQSETTMFYLAVICGITSGAVTHGFAYARIPICFIVPPLASVIMGLLLYGSFQRYILAATVVLYLAALIRGARVGEELVVRGSRLKNEATRLAQSLEIANEEKTRFAVEMQRRAVRDKLTDLLNRSGFADAVEQYSKNCKHALLMMLDLDGFKSVNDAYGHKAGDQVLVEVARRLTELLADFAILSRLGGDEFAILVKNDIAEEEAELLANRIIATISIPFFRLDPGRIGTSVGIYIGDVSNIDEALINADTALYAAKRGGRNQYRSFDERLKRDSEIVRDVERDLSEALANENLEVWFQPIISTENGTVDTFEALLRWKHPKHGWIQPNAIVESAATAGFADILLSFLVREVSLMIVSLQSHGFTNIRIAVNISPRELSEIAVDEIILSKLSKFGISTNLLQLEITEEAALHMDLVKTKLEILSHNGVSLSIDDFGTGYSSLGLLRQIKAQRVKIDKSLVTGSRQNAMSRSLIEAILKISQALELDVVADGVETLEDFELMSELECPYQQGHYFAKPMPKELCVKWVMQNFRVNKH